MAVYYLKCFHFFGVRYFGFLFHYLVNLDYFLEFALLVLLLLWMIFFRLKACQIFVLFPVKFFFQSGFLLMFCICWQPEPDNTITKTPSVEESIIAAETARELYRLIESLSPSLQKIIKLYYLEGKSNREIAVELDIEPDTVIRQRLRAIIALRKFKISPALYLLFYTREIQHIITCDSL
jgi:hypothetical protein